MGRDMIELVRLLGDCAVAKVLLVCIALVLVPGCGPSPHAAARTGDYESLAKMLADGLDPDVRDARQHTPLMYAVGYGHENVVRLLLANGADVHAAYRAGPTPVHWAAIMGRAEILRLLLDSGGAVDERTQNGMTPLHEAAREGHALRARPASRPCSVQHLAAGRR